MPSPYDYASTTGYGRTRADWTDFPSTTTPITQAQLDQFDQATYDLKKTAFNVKDYLAKGDNSTDDTTAIQNTVNACDTAGGGVVFFPPGTYVYTTLSLVSKNNVWLVGSGITATTLKSSTTTGNLIDLTGASFCQISNMQLLAGAQRSAGAVVYMDAGAGTCQRNQLSNLRFLGGWRGIFLDDCTTTSITEVQFTDFNATHPWHSLINLGGQSTSVMMQNIRGGTAAAVTNAFLYINGTTVDSVQCSNFDILNLGGSGYHQVVVDNGQWIKFVSCSFEAGTVGEAFVMNAGRAVDLVGCHLLGKHGALINGGNAVRILGGDIVGCYNGGVSITGGNNHSVIGASISDCSVQTNNTYDGVNVAANVNDFVIADNTFGDYLLSGNDMATAVTVQAGTSNRYVIQGNRVAATGVLTPLSDNGTGTDKTVRDNVWASSGYGTVTAAANINPNGTLGNCEVIEVTGNTNITSMTASSKGRRLTLVFTGTPTFTDGSNLKLAGNFVAAGATNDKDTITVVSDGTNWIEVARSTN